MHEGRRKQKKGERREEKISRRIPQSCSHSLVTHEGGMEAIKITKDGNGEVLEGCVAAVGLSDDGEFRVCECLVVGCQSSELCVVLLRVTKEILVPASPFFYHFKKQKQKERGKKEGRKRKMGEWVTCQSVVVYTWHSVRIHNHIQ